MTARFRHCIILFAAVLGLLAAPAGALAQDTLPDRPAVPYAHLKGTRYKIVNFRNEYPRVIVDGKETSAEVGVYLTPGDTFLPGYINIEESSVTNLIERKNFRGDTKAVDSRFRATLIADRDLDDVFLLFLLYGYNEGDYSRMPSPTIVDYAIGHLKVAKHQAVEFEIPATAQGDQVAANTMWIVLAYSGGVQVKTSMGNAVLNRFFDIAEHVQQHAFIAKRSTGDQPLAVFRRFPLTFSDALHQEYRGQTFNVQLSVTSEGAFKEVVLEDQVAADLSDSLSSQLRNWLFLPQVKDGVPTDSAVLVPVRL